VGGFRATLVPELIARFGGRRDSFASLDDRLATALYLAAARSNFDQFSRVRRYFAWFVTGHKTLLQKNPARLPSSDNIKEAT
jgi:hypothetical protein